jgi:type I restriction enzyme S subunit
MTARATPRSHMKKSGIPWLGEIPQHWKLLPNRTIFQEIKEQRHDDEELLSVTISRGVIRQADLLANTAKKDASNLDKSKYKLVQPGDLVYNKMRAWQGAIGVSSDRGIVSPAYIVQRLRVPGLPRYFHYLFRLPAFAAEAERWSYGITSDQWSLRAEHFKKIYSCLPPLDSQTAIVRFLDYLDRSILRYIQVKQKLIALLEEQIRATVIEAMTRGVSGGTLKESGIDWVPQVPSHWEIIRLRQTVTACIGGVWGEDPDGDEDLVCVRVADFDRTRCSVSLVSPTYRKISLSERRRRILSPGDLLIEKSGGGDQQLVGAVVLYEHDTAAVCSNFVARMPTAPGFDPQFLTYLHLALYARRISRRSIKQTTGIQNLDMSEYMREKVAVPAVGEQSTIATHLKGTTSQSLAAVEKTEREIKLIREYRTSLIADAVTGKLDVRGPVSRLPNDASESERYDGIEELVGLGEEDGYADLEVALGEVHE